MNLDSHKNFRRSSSTTAQKIILTGTITLVDKFLVYHFFSYQKTMNMRPTRTNTLKGPNYILNYQRIIYERKTLKNQNHTKQALNIANKCPTQLP